MPDEPIYLIGPLPPPVTGHSVAFEMLRDAVRAGNVTHRVIDIGRGADARRDSGFSLLRAASMVGPAFRALRLVFARKGVVYLTIAQSWKGFLRDSLFISLAALGRHRIVLHLHGGNYAGFYQAQSPSRQRLVARTMGKASEIIVLSESLKNGFSFLPEAGPKLTVVANGLPIPADRLPSTPKSLPGTSGDPIRILFLSSMMESKGYLALLKAVRLLSEKGIPVQCSFCGGFAVPADSPTYSSASEAENDFRQKVKTYGLTDNVTWEGHVDGKDKEELLRRAHFFVLPTTYVNEGQPIAVIEALAFGCAVISTRHRAIPEMLDNGEAGALLDAPDPDAIAQTIVSLARQPENFNQLSTNAMAQYRNCFTRELYESRLLSILTRASPATQTD